MDRQQWVQSVDTDDHAIECRVTCQLGFLDLEHDHNFLQHDFFKYVLLIVIIVLNHLVFIDHNNRTDNELHYNQHRGIHNDDRDTHDDDNNHDSLHDQSNGHLSSQWRELSLQAHKRLDIHQCQHLVYGQRKR